MISMLQRVELIAFDLDNTLYDEGTYFDAAFEQIAPVLAQESTMSVSAIRGRLSEILSENGKHYHQLFTDLLADLGLPADIHLPEVLQIYCTVPARLELSPGARELLRDLSERYRLAMITGGMEVAQRNKIDLLGLQETFEHIVYSSSLSENKPGKEPFNRLLHLTGVSAGTAAYVGDNPMSDFRGANELGMITIRVPNPEFNGYEAQPGLDGRIRVTSLEELRPLFLQ